MLRFFGRRCVDDDPEFVTPQSRDDRTWRNQFTDFLVDDFQHIVAGAVAECVVDVLEAVEVQKRNGESFVAGADPLGQGALEGHPIRRPRQEIVTGNMHGTRLARGKFVDLGLQRFDLADIEIPAMHEGGRHLNDFGCVERL